MNKIQNLSKDYKKLLGRLEHYSICYSLNFLFGREEDHERNFDGTLRFLHEVKAPEAFFNTVTPRRGTPMRTKLGDEGQVIIPDADLYRNNF